MPGYDPTWLDILACPVCQGGLEEVEASLRCSVCERVFPIRDGVPDLIADGSEAERDHE
jgi:uncharacterized protein YbaR (Trm112 family)